MRAVEIAVFLILLQASVGFVSGMGIFGPDLHIEDNAYTSWGIDNFDDDIELAEQSSLTSSIELLWKSLSMILEMLLAVLVIYPILVSTFYIPSTVAVLLQGGVYCIYMLGVIEFLSGRQLW